MTITNKMRELLDIIGCDLVTNRSMTTDEILECVHCTVAEDGEIIDQDSGKPTGIWYEELL